MTAFVVMSTGRPAQTGACADCEKAGDLVRVWRQRRGLSQLALSVDAQVSTRHLSFVESGRSGASRDLLIRLADCLALPLREQNRLLVAGGYAPLHGARQLDDPELNYAVAALDAVIDGHRPFPALLVDRRWQLVMANAPALSLIEGIGPHLAVPPINLMRVALHPQGLAPRILNFAEWRAHLLNRLKTEIIATGGADLTLLYDELLQLPVQGRQLSSSVTSPIAVPLVIRSNDNHVLTLLSTTTVFGTANDLTLSELMLECLFPVDDATREYFMSKGSQSS